MFDVYPDPFFLSSIGSGSETMSPTTRARARRKLANQHMKPGIKTSAFIGVSIRSFTNVQCILHYIALYYIFSIFFMTFGIQYPEIHCM